MSELAICASIDDVLGPAESRYYGLGFQRVTHYVSDLHVRCNGIAGSVEGCATVTYPVDWSTGRTEEPVRPHLSTVDALIIASQMAEVFLMHTHELDPKARHRMRLRAFSMSAGSQAEEYLSDFVVYGSRYMIMSLYPEDILRQVTSVFRFFIGTFRLCLEIDHDLGTRDLKPAYWPDFAAAIGHPVRRHHTDGFARRRHSITDVVVDMSVATGWASVQVTDTTEHQPERMSPTLGLAQSMVDATVCAAQLAQALMYKLEGVQRSETDTLWMRRCEMRSPQPSRADLEELTTSSARVHRRRRIDRMGRSWRTYELVGNVGFTRARTALAFNVPGAVSHASSTHGEHA